jgi:hypothetical protein
MRGCRRQAHGGQLALQRALGSWGASQAYARAHLDDYFYDSDDVPDSMGGMSPCGGAPFCGPPGLDERSARRRSGWGLETGLEHVLPIDTGMQALSDLALRGGYAFGLFDSRGREYTHHRSTWRVGASARLPFQVGADVSGSYAYRQYRHPSTFPDPPLVPNAPYTLSGVRRREQTFVVETALSRPITRQVVVSARWRYVDNESNRKVFDYEQQVFGLYLDVSIGREL